MIGRIVWSVAILAIVGVTAAFALGDWSAPEAQIPTARPVQGDIEVEVHALGDLNPRRTMALSAPPSGSLLQIVMLAPAGSLVREGEVVIEFDRAEQEYRLQQAESELAEAEQEIAKLMADRRVQESTDTVSLLHARHELRRAEIDVSGNEFLGRIDAEKNLIKLDEARKALAQLEIDIKARAEGGRASLAVLEEKRTKARIAADYARRSIESLTVRAPMDGRVVLKDNRDAAGNFGFPGMTLPEYRQGDTVQPGRIVADIVDLGEMEIRTSIPETDRSAIAEGAAVAVHVEALPDQSLTGTSKGIGGLAQTAFWEPQSTRRFTAAFVLAQPPEALRPGMTARLVVDGGTLEGVIHLPRQALFEVEGRPVVYVRRGGGFEATPVQIVRLTEHRVVLKEFPLDAEVALVDPQRDAAGSPPAAPPPGPMAGGAR
jgi:multidrug efflux pump subunit AcrA (membrane-fusion protein)